MPSRSHCIPRLIAFYFKSSNAKLIPLHALSLPFITGILCNWPPTLLVTKRVEEWVLIMPPSVKQSQSMLGSFGWTKTMMAAETTIWLWKCLFCPVKQYRCNYCFAVAFWTQASTCFITSNIHFLHCHIFILSHLLNTIFISLHVLSLLFMKCHL